MNVKLKCKNNEKFFLYKILLKIKPKSVFFTVSLSDLI